MGQEWHIQLKGKQREKLDRQLLVQALIALQRQIQGEAAKQASDEKSESQKGEQ